FPSAAVSFVLRPPADARGGAAAEEAAALKAGYDSGTAAPRTAADVDGLPAASAAGSGAKHLTLEAVPQVAMEAHAYLRERGQNSVWAKVDYSARGASNPYVVVRPAETVEVDARLEDRVLLVPLRARLLRVAFRWDESDAAGAERAADEFLAGLRVHDR